jgi:hypothetical protein
LPGSLNCHIVGLFGEHTTREMGRCLS